jgi:hypothetical protein
VSIVTFAQLADHLEAAGIEVGVALTDGGHELVLRDGDRALRFAVTGSFDAAATVLTLSASLQIQLVPQTPAGQVRSAAYDWPELHDLWVSCREL